MRLRHIEVFHAVYTTRSITAAARLLSVSQPSISKVLAHAEQQLGFALFERQKGKLIPTQEAEHLIHHVTGAYDNISELRRVSENLRNADSGQIRIATIPALGLNFLPAAIVSYRELHPTSLFNIESMQVNQIISALREHRTGIGLAYDPPVTPGVKADVLGSGELVVLSHVTMDLGQKDELTFQDLQGMPLITLSTEAPLGKMLANHIDASNIEFDPVATVETFELASALVAQGAGIAIVDEITANAVAQSTVVHRLRPVLRFDVAVLRDEGKSLSIITKRFIEHLQAEIDQFLGTPFRA